jgi:hypothetical protein
LAVKKKNSLFLKKKKKKKEEMDFLERSLAFFRVVEEVKIFHIYSRRVEMLSSMCPDKYTQRLSDLDVIEPLYNCLFYTISAQIQRIYKTLPRKIKRLREADKIKAIVSRSEKTVLNDISFRYPREKTDRKWLQKNPIFHQKTEMHCSKEGNGSSQSLIGIVQKKCWDDVSKIHFSLEVVGKKITGHADM